MSCRSLAVVVLLGLGCHASSSDAAGLVLADGGVPAYAIVVADDASPSTRHGAEELQTFLEEITGAKLPIVSDTQPMGPKEIILGDNAHFRLLATDIDVASLGDEGYVIRTVGDRLVIVGGALRGTMYGVYGLLEDHLGCRWFAPDCRRIPKSTRLVVGPLDDRQIPALEYRDVFLAECFDGDWCARNRLNSSHGRLDATRGGHVTFGDRFFVHTFAWLVPPEKYFAEHPEYFAMIDGKRVKEQRGIPAQLCCTNPEVIRLCTEGVLAAMRAQPSATVFSVSQNDAYAGPNQCECPRCQAMARDEGSQMAPVLLLVNQVAEAVEKEFPDKIIETLAYQWSRRPPQRMRPRPNVVIRLCSSTCRCHPMATCDSDESRAFRDDLAAWSKACNRLWVWDYVTNFAYYLAPFPTERARTANISFLAAQHVTGVFALDSYTSPESELAALDGYLSAKCLWNPGYDVNVALSEFLEGYYNKAAEPIREYIDMMQDHVDRNNIHTHASIGCDGPHLDDDLLQHADAMWQRAEEAVGDDAIVLHRVKIGRLSVDYAIVERARLRAQGVLPPHPDATALATARLAPFAESLRRSAVAQLGESQPLDKEAYLGGLAKELGLEIK